MTMHDVRKKTLGRLSSIGLDRNPALPLLESHLPLRSKEETAHRANLLHIFYAIYLQGRDSVGHFHELVQREKWEAFLTQRERALLSTGQVTEQDLVDFSWNKEAVKVLLWIGSQIDDDLERDFRECDFSLYYPLLPPQRSFQEYLRSFCLRETSLMAEYLDLYYCLHWYCRNHKADTSERGVNESVVIERRKAFEWVTHRQEWDQVALDT
jgi:hypothetical protein